MGGYINHPANEIIEDPHHGVEYDYEYAGEKVGEQLSLLIHSWIIDYEGKVYSRKGTYILHRKDAIECISEHLKGHLVNMGVDDMTCRRLMRGFTVDKNKCIPYDIFTFNRI
jgi:hypothetical protein